MCEMDDGELIVKTSSDCWVVGKRCDKREVYVVISHKNANLIEINGIIQSHYMCRSLLFSLYLLISFTTLQLCKVVLAMTSLSL